MGRMCLSRPFCLSRLSCPSCPLTTPAPIREPRVDTGLARLNQRAALPARLPTTSVNPQLRVRIETARRPASDRDRQRLRAAEHVGGEEIARHADRAHQCVIRELADRDERIDAADEQDLRLQDVADSRDDALVEQHVALKVVQLGRVGDYNLTLVQTRDL